VPLQPYLIRRAGKYFSSAGQTSRELEMIKAETQKKESNLSFDYN
jgi:hypothetical protein